MSKEIKLLDRVRGVYPSLSKSQRLIADSILENWESTAFVSPRELGERLGVSETTVIRFAKSLGYSNFSELREHSQILIKEKLTPAEKMSATVKKIKSGETTFERLLTSEIENLKDGISKVSSDEFYRAVELIEKAERVFVAGQGVSEALCKFLEFRFRRMQIDTRPVIGGGKAFYETLLLLNDRDVLFGIGFFRCSQDILRSFDYARKKRIHTIAMTHSRVSELALKSEVTLVANRGPVSLLNSLVVPMAILNALVLYIAERDSKKLDALKKLDEIPDIFGFNGKH
ncbi:MAG: MurR/RpiR family transcriptional regulator [Kosmotogaceae bacterium]|nr:MurR/RpiR family transcriptional regulator [Kosmotogaceae bacterium]